MPLTVRPGGFSAHSILPSAALDAALQDSRPLFVRKSAPQNYTTATMTDDAELYGTLAANAAYIVRGLLCIVGLNGKDFRYGFTLPAGATMDIGGAHMAVPASGSATWGTINVLVLLAQAAPTTGAITAAVTSAAMNILLDCYVTTGITAGTLQLQCRQDTADPTNPTILLAGSRMDVTRVA